MRRVAAMDGIKTLARWDIALLVSLPFAVAFGSLATLHISTIDVTATVAVILGLGLLAVRREPVAMARTLPEHLLLWSLSALVGLMLLSLLWSANHVDALKEAVKWCIALLLVLMAPRLLRASAARWLVVGAVVAAALAEALIGFAQATIFASMQARAADRGLRVIGTFGQPNPYAGYIDMALPLCVAVALCGTRISTRLAAAGAGMVLLVALGLADSRGATMGLVAALGVMAVAVYPWLWRWALAAVAIGTLGIAFWPGLAASVARTVGWRPLTDAALSSGVNDANFSSVERLAHWAAALRMAMAHPLTGVGIGNYPDAYGQYAVPDWPRALGHAHNLYLNMAAELGIGGCLLYSLFVAATLWLCWLLATGARGDRRMLGVGLLGVATALAVHQCFDDLTTHDMLIQFALMLALARAALDQVRATR